MNENAPRTFSAKALTRILTDVLQSRPATALTPRPVSMHGLAPQADVQAAALAFQEAVETELLTRRLQQNRAGNFPVLDALLSRLTLKPAA